MVRSQHQHARQDHPPEASGQRSDSRSSDPSASQELPETPRKAELRGTASSLSRLNSGGQGEQWKCQVCTAIMSRCFMVAQQHVVGAELRQHALWDVIAAVQGKRRLRSVCWYCWLPRSVAHVIFWLAQGQAVVPLMMAWGLMYWSCRFKLLDVQVDLAEKGCFCIRANTLATYAEANR